MLDKRLKTFTPVLVFFLIVVVAFFAVQVINTIFINDPLPEASQKQLEQLNPNLNQEVFGELEKNE